MLSRRLVLFDIDGTILHDRGAARAAFADALFEIYGYEGDSYRYDFSGRTDPEIAHMVLGDAGFSREQIEARLDSLWDVYLAGLERKLPMFETLVIGGMRTIIERLSTDSSVVIALLTGNIERGARLKLGSVKLNEYFPFGAFGSDSADRTELPRVAMQRASELYQHEFKGRDVVIIGDSIYDVRCGVPYGATTIAIATGRTSVETLRAENPTYLFENTTAFGALDEMMSRILF